MNPFLQMDLWRLAVSPSVAWSSLYSTVSRPFPRPTTGRIAVKVINHYGDEVLKVYALARVAGI